MRSTSAGTGKGRGGAPEEVEEHALAGAVEGDGEGIQRTGYPDVSWYSIVYTLSVVEGSDTTS